LTTTDEGIGWLCDCLKPLVEGEPCEVCEMAVRVDGEWVYVSRPVNLVMKHPVYNFKLRL
jgi:hypothetical protein